MGMTHDRDRAASPGSDSTAADRPASGRSVATRRLQRKATGAPLPAAPRERLEASLHADLGDVRVHDDPEANRAATDLGAQAFTVGQDISFAPGRLAPDDPFGMHLLAHEVAHTVQQGNGGSRGQRGQRGPRRPGQARGQPGRRPR
jgi:hypothetical protein